ncbi:glutathionylspermidine synthase family protein [Aeromonas dhakensis]|uniref:glutathionylspermidine synthase family protein n=1 Tax=Aeromonas dhakensis TaxID=196024 RepID=UPI003D1B5964
MERIALPERPDWRERAADLGFEFHTFDGEPYWDESACYRFSLRQIEEGLETPTEELHQMALSLVSKIVVSEELLTRLDIPEYCWPALEESWRRQDPHIYGRLDLAYDGHGPAKLLELNYDTPTSLYESGFFQWIWLEDQVRRGGLPTGVDQFNSLQEKLHSAFAAYSNGRPLHFTCVGENLEDKGNLDYLIDIALQTGCDARFVDLEDIGEVRGQLVDLGNEPIHEIFKLYPWEFMVREPFGQTLLTSQTRFIEPAWKMILSNKGVLPLLWQDFPDHPNLLPAFFDEQPTSLMAPGWVRKPLYSREGANIELVDHDGACLHEPGPYDDSGYVRQAFHPLPCFAGSYTLVGSWVVGNEAAGIGIREDATLITKDSSRFLPHIILD